MTSASVSRRLIRILPAALLLAGTLMPAAAQAQDRPARFLTREEIVLYGIGLKVEPAHQTVPKDIATIVSAYLQTPQLPANISPFAPDAVVKATLRGPSFAVPQELTVAPNSPFHIPALTVPGTHTLENIRLISGGEVLLRGAPEQVTIEVIERLLVTQVTARPLTAAEIREKGIVYDQSNFQAYNFSAAFAIQDRTVDISFPVLLPSIQGAADVQVGTVRLPGVSAPGLPQLKTIIPDTLKLQTQVPNLSVVGFTLKAPALEGGQFVVPPIPGVIVIPGDIGFLNQYFSVLLMVGNVAPAGSGLNVTDISAEIVLPPGRDGVVNTPDDPLKMAQTTSGEAPRVKLVVQPGPDGKLGTSDDVGMLRPGDSGNAEYLVEGRREGSHVVEMEITGTLHGLPVGPVQIRGRAAGAVLVRNPKFTLTFTHPEAVAAGEPYTLDVTVTNTSESPANFVNLALYPRNVSGATIIGEPTRGIESILPGDSATVSFDLVSRITGKVTAATLDSDDKVAGRFELKAAVGELGVPVSPDTLVLPKEAGSLPADFRAAALGLLGKAYAVATAPAAALPPDVRRFSRKVVIDRAVEVAEAGFRHTLKEPLADSAAQLLMDFMGSNYTRLAHLVPAADLEFEQDNYTGFDELRRKSVRGDTFAAAVGSLLSPALTAQGPALFHRDLAARWSYRPGHVSILVGAMGELPVALSVVDGDGRVVGARGADGKIIKEIAFSDLLPFTDTGGLHVGEMAVLAAPQAGSYTVRLARRSLGAAPITVSVVVPEADGSLRHTVFNLAPGQVPAPMPGTPLAFTFEWVDAAGTTGTPVPAASTEPILDPAPHVISVIQQKEADQISCDAGEPGFPVGRVVAVLFSEEVTPASVFDRMKPEDIQGFAPEGNRVVGVALQPGRRIAFVALRDPIGPFVPRQITIDGAVDLRGRQMVPFTGPMETTVGTGAGLVTGRVVRADGTVVPFANVRLFYLLQCEGAEPRWVGIASKSADHNGAFSWDYVLRSLPDRIVAIDPETDEFRSIPFNIQRDGQQLNLDIVFLGRGTFSGTTRSESGAVLADTAIRITSLTDSSQYGARTDADGRFTIARIPVGNIYVEAVNTTAKAKFTFSELIPFAGATVDRDITLLDIEQRQTTVKHGTVRGYVLRTDGATPASGVPVFVWYTHNSQPGVRCPGDPAPAECAIAGGETKVDGSFEFEDVAAGTLRVSAFDQDGLVQGEARLQLAADATVNVNVLLVGGLGTVRGRVVSPDGTGVAGATVGGGLSLVTTNNNGEFTLDDVPVGRRDIVAVSELLRSSGRVTVDLTRTGDTVNALIVLDSVGSVSGTVVSSDGKTPVAGAAVHVFRQAAGGYEIVGSATTDANGGYRIDGIRIGEYKVSSFNAGFTDGNIVPAVLKFHQQVFRADIRWRGGSGKVTGRVLDDDGETPLRAMVSLSGDQVLVAGGRVGVAFQHVNHYKIAESDFTTGQFTLTGALVGKVTVSAAGQFSPDPIAVEATIPSANATVTVDLKLQPTSEIRGVVLQPNGVTPAGANVLVQYKSEAFKVICTTSAMTGEESCDSIPQGIQEENVVTDEFGRFWLPIVNAGPFSISVEDPVTGKVGQIKGAVRAGEDAEVSVRLLGMGELAVQVMSSDKQTPIPGAKVVVRQLNHPKKEVEGRAGTDGAIVFAGGDGLSEGEFAIEATDLRNGFAGRGSAKITTDGEQVSVTVYLFDASGTVSGRIFAPNGVTPVPNAEIVLSNNAGPLAFALSDVDGSYSIGLVPLGDFRVEAFEARTARRAAARGRVDLAGQDVPVNLTQAGLGVVKGRVMDSVTFEPFKGWTVTLGQRSASGLALGTLQTTSAVDGSYLFPGTAQGTFSLTARHADVNGSASASGTIEREGETVDVPLLVKVNRPLTGTISGVVLTANGEPAPDRPVEICHPARTCEAPVQITADAEGRFSLADVPLGRFVVTARSQVTREAGSIQGELRFDGDIASVRVILEGLAEVNGIVERGGTPAAGIRVTLTGIPSAGCTGASCVVFTDEQGAFRFADVPAKTYTVTAEDPLNPSLKGSAGGGLLPGEVEQVRIVLTPTFAVTGRVLLPGNVPAARVIAEMVLSTTPARHIYAETDADGIFTFAAVPPGAHQILFSDPIGSGEASRNISVTADLTLPDTVLDTAVPSVVSSSPAHAEGGVLENVAVRITFSEPIRPGTINAQNVSLTGPGGAVTATLDVTDNDTVVTLRPLAALEIQTRYTLRVANVEDRFGKVMAGDYVATFTTIDRTAPTVAEASPAPSTSGAPIYTPIRIRFSESVDITRFSSGPLVLTGPSGQIAGRTDYLLGNTVVVFTPNLPLAEDTQYTVTLERATDLSGNQQPQAFTYQFTTTDRTPPQIAALVAANDGKVVENGITSVLAQVGATHDVAVVDWYINDVLAFADRSAPFELSFKADVALYGPAGSQIRIAGIATDTSGNRGTATEIEITVTPDIAPTVTILGPADGLSVKTGDRVVVQVRATDDLGVTQIGYRAVTNNPADALTRPVSPSSQDRTEEFVFYIPGNIEPGTTIVVHASASDTKGQVAQASLGLRVQDAAPPTVTITGATSGTHVLPGAQTSVIVRAEDIGRIASVRFTASGAVTFVENRTIDPAQASVLTSFTVTVPTTAQAGQTIVLNASATDAAGNSANAGQLVLTVADTVPPTLTLAPENGTLTAMAGRSVNVVAQAGDSLGITRIDLTASGAVTFSDATQVSPPIGSATKVFSIPVPESALPGSQIHVVATARDLSGNVSEPAVLTLTVVGGVQVSLPSSAIVDAGASVELQITLTEPAPAGGTRIDFTSDSANVATATTFVVIPEGQTAATFTVTGVAGGTTQVRALSGGFPRASMTVSVRGGIVTGVVRDIQLQPVPNAQLTISGGGSTESVTADENGFYMTSGIYGPTVSVRALDPVTRLYGHASGSMARELGFATVNVVLIPATAVHGTVFDATGTPAGAGVRVDIGNVNGGTPLSTVFTNEDGGYEFPLVTLGQYRIDATGLDGRKGRSTILLTESGRDAEVNVVYLGTGTVTGTVLLNNTPVPNAQLTFVSSSIFGAAPRIERSAEPDGTFTFTDVLLGNFTVIARDEATGQAGSATGTLSQHDQQVPVTVTLSTYGTVEGFVYRNDGTTPVSGATVRLSPYRTTTTDQDGFYRFDIVPLGSYTVQAEEPSTRGYGAAPAMLSTHNATAEANISFLPQARLLVTVTDPGRGPVEGAFVSVWVQQGSREDYLSGRTGENGTVLIEQVLAGTYRVSASYGAQRGEINGTLAAGELKEVSVELSPTGSLAGIVYEPDGQTPAAGARVSIPKTEISVVTGTDGSFRIDGRPLGRYDLSVRDAGGRLRAFTSAADVSDDLVITSNGQVAERNFTFIGLGTVTGEVVNPNGSAAQNMSVEIRYLAPGFEASASTRTDAGGEFTFANVPVGAFRVIASSASLQLYGEAQGVVTAHNGGAEVAIALTSNVVSLPTTLYDANNLAFDIQRMGGLQTGSFLFNGNNTTERGAMLLDITAAGSPVRFSGPEIPVVEEAGREIVVRQENLGGLSVTRKIYVPRDGYFARYLEIFRNPGEAPVTIHVDVTSHPTGTGTRLAATADGDTSFTTADDWFTTTRDGGLSSAMVIQGAAATARIGAAAYALHSQGSSVWARASYGWRGLTVEPGETVVLMHFAVQQLTPEGALAAAQRLSQLPPEALAGLSPEEYSAVRNFVMPADGTSEVEPLPAVTGKVTGTVYEHDGATIVRNATVQLTSDLPFFSRTLTVNTNELGQYSITGALNDFGSSVALPAAGFSVRATHPASQVVSPIVTGVITSPTLPAVADVTFANTSIVTGVVKRHTGAVVQTGGSVVLTGGPLTSALSASLQGDGSFRLTGVPAGSYTLSAYALHSQGSSLSVAQPITVEAGDLYPFELLLPATGTIAGTVVTAKDQPAVNVLVTLRQGSLVRTVRTGSGGTYSLPDIPEGAVTVTATEPATDRDTTVAATAVRDVTVPVNITLIKVGAVRAHVTLASGQPAVGAAVEVRFTSRNQTVLRTGTVDGSGRALIEGIPEGAFTVRASHPANTSLVVSATGEVTETEPPVDVVLELPAAGSVTVTVTRGAGGAVSGSQVTLIQPGRTDVVKTTPSSGQVVFGGVSGAFTVRANHPENRNLTASANGTITAEGEESSRALQLPAIGTVTGVVKLGTSAVGGVTVTLRSSSGAIAARTATTLDDGSYTITGVPAGLFSVTVDDAVRRVYGTASAEVTSDLQTVIVNLALIDNAIQLPTNLTDGNGFLWDLQPAGYIDNGSSDAYDGGMRLRLTQGTTTTTFAGTSSAVTEEAGREVVIKQPWILGLDVTRKVYVPADGYFARYLEVLTNPGTAPVTVDLVVYSNMGSDGNTNGVATSSGDTSFGPEDFWLVTDDADNSGDPSMVHVIAGPGGVRVLDIASRSGDSIEYGWNNITVAPGQSVVLMHFATQHFTRAQARAAGERLVQLPPEALTGLSLDEILAIENFAVPPDGGSPLPEARRPTFGTVTGRVFAVDGQTAVPGAQVEASGANLLFGRRQVVTVNAEGRFTATGIPTDAFTLRATHLPSAMSTAVVNGTFDIGQTETTQDLVFSDTAMVRGSVRRSGGALHVTDGEIYWPYTAPITDGQYLLPVVAPGETWIEGVAYHPQGGWLSLSAVANLPAGQSIVDLQLPPVGTLTGLVTTASGAAAPGVIIEISGDDGYRTTATTPEGWYTFSDLPVGTYWVTAFHPQTNTPTSVEAALVADASTRADIALHGLATLTGRLSNPDGSPAQGAKVVLTHSQSYYQAQTTTNTEGDYVFQNVPSVGLELYAYSPGYTAYVFRRVDVPAVPDGQTGTANVTVLGVSTLRVYVRDAGGAPLAGRPVSFMWPYAGYESHAGYTNASGYLDIQTPEGFYRVSTNYGGTNVARQGTILPSDHGQVIEVELRDRVPGRLHGVVYAGDGITPVPYATVMVYEGGAAALGIYANAFGEYDSGPAQLPSTPFTIETDVEGITGSATASVADDGTDIRRDITVPVAVIKGHVYYHGGTSPVLYPGVFATSAGEDGRTFYSRADGLEGEYFFAVPAGTYRLLAQDSYGLTARDIVEVTAVTQVISRDLVMPPTGRLTGEVRTANGDLVPDAEVLVWSPLVDGILWAYTDFEGKYRLDNVPVGPFTVEACSWEPVLHCEAVAGEMPADPAAQVVNVRLPQFGSLLVNVTDASGNVPDFAEITVTGVTRHISVGTRYETTTLHPSIPEGTVLVTVLGEGDAAATVEATILAGRQTTVDVQLGSALPLPRELTGTDNFIYDIGCYGDMNDGGHAVRGWYDAFDTVATLNVAWQTIPCRRAARTVQGGRELILGPALAGGNSWDSYRPQLLVTRRIFVPASGGFARYYEEVTNVGPITRTFTVEIGGNYGPSASATNLPVGPSSTGNTYAVFSTSDTNIPAVGLVFGGAGAASLPQVSMRTGDDYYTYQWTVTLAPGQSVAVLHYVLQRAPGDVAGTQAAAMALASGADPLGLQGLSAEQRGRILNFAGIGGTTERRATVEGTVLSADGETPLAGAAVYALDAATGRYLAGTVTGESGTYRFEGLVVSPAGVKVMAAYGSDPNHTATTVVPVSEDGQVTSGVTLVVPVTPSPLRAFQ